MLPCSGVSTPHRQASTNTFQRECKHVRLAHSPRALCTLCRRRASKLQGSRRPRWLPLRVPLTQSMCRATCGVRGASLMIKSSSPRAAVERCTPGAPLTLYGRAGLWSGACTSMACARAGTTAACSIRWQQVRGRCSPAGVSSGTSLQRMIEDVGQTSQPTAMNEVFCVAWAVRRTSESGVHCIIHVPTLHRGDPLPAVALSSLVRIF